MKRITILSLYDVFNQVDYCTQKLICDIRQYSDYLFIVCNFSSDADVDEFLRKNSDYVLIRDNTGFDGGAIKDAISVLLSNKTGVSINDFDEILILNDTFYGFFLQYNHSLTGLEDLILILPDLQRTMVDICGGRDLFLRMSRAMQLS